MKVYNERLLEPMTEQLTETLVMFRRKRAFDANDYIERKCNLLNDYMRKFGLKACVVAVSGGIDSAVVLGLVKRASLLDDSPISKIVPLLLPIFGSTGVTNQNDATLRGEEWCQKLNIPSYVIDLTDINQIIKNEMEQALGIVSENWATGQLGPYSRTPIIYYATSLLSQIGLGAVVCGTNNTDEGAYLGYLGKASDGMVDLQMISDIHKSEVYQVASELGVTESILDVVPNGDMYDNRTDEMVFGAPYDFVELYLNYLKLDSVDQISLINGFDQKTKKQFSVFSSNLENLHCYNAHKYLSKSPAIHLDLWDSSIKGGWDNYHKVVDEIFQ